LYSQLFYRLVLPSNRFFQAGIQKKGDSKRKDDKGKSLEETNKKYFQGCQILERMVNQNIYDEISQGTVPTLDIMIFASVFYVWF
jgi:hypothetical protein